MEERTLDTKYMAIRVWGNMMGSYEGYIIRQQEKALEDNAPLNAIYITVEGEWHTVDDITSEETKAWLLKRIKAMNK